MRRRQHLGLRALLDDPALLHDHDLVGDRLHGREVVGDEQVGDAELLLQPVAAASGCPSATSWSSAEVTSSQMMRSRLGGERPGDADALLLAARQLAGQTVDEVARSSSISSQQLADAPLAAPALQARDRTASGRPMIRARAAAD